MKLAALQLQTANKGYGVDAKAFEDHILLLTSADGKSKHFLHPL